ncbi:MAG TPA: iron-containing alcohol dehydrogenase [bacterium]|nr:iron-containing alcohol dehydrogenase [bacterium]HNT65246.1 iron-containing alcohol dehydrogenase [bacterium]HOX86951.1 iron-containing alcohol dehydrogenase [bacterium]HPG46282.1 iron-containing alcohol dehydrogenase [bacterium]HPM98524.1 iron-containing alcohol dehydrogenase [bacterium]
MHTDSEQRLIEEIVTQTVDEISVANHFTFRVPPLAIVGDGVAARTGDELQRLKATRVLIVTDTALIDLGLLSGVLRSMQRRGLAFELFAQINGEPTWDMVTNGAAAFQQSRCDAVLAFGGGSPIDAAKMIAVLARNPLPFAEMDQTSDLKQGRPPLAAMPTTAGTASEVTDLAVIGEPAGGRKVVFEHPALVPDLAIIDPLLTVGLPPKVTAATGIDVLTHAIEAYVARSSCTLARALSYRAIRLVATYLPIAAGYGSNVLARHKMAVACYMAGMAFSNAGLGLCHAMAHPLGGRYKIAHGNANALLLQHVMRYNLMVRIDEFADVALALGERVENLSKREAAESAVTATARLIQDLGLPTHLRDFGVTAQELPPLAEFALRDSCLRTNPRSAQKEEIIEIYQQAL